jgi:hypothetical protein
MVTARGDSRVTVTAYNGSVPGVTTLIETGTEPDRRDAGRTPRSPAQAGAFQARAAALRAGDTDRQASDLPAAGTAGCGAAAGSHS